MFIGALFTLFAWGPWSPANRARALTRAATQELYSMPAFTILDQVSEEHFELNGCTVNQNTLRIGSPVSLSESVALFTETVQKDGWTRQPDNYAGVLYYFQRKPGEVLVLYTENIGPREWLQPPQTGSYSSYVYVVVASGMKQFVTCPSF